MTMNDTSDDRKPSAEKLAETKPVGRRAFLKGAAAAGLAGAGAAAAAQEPVMRRTQRPVDPTVRPQRPVEPGQTVVRADGIGNSTSIQEFRCQVAMAPSGDAWRMPDMVADMLTRQQLLPQAEVQRTAALVNEVVTNLAADQSRITRVDLAVDASGQVLNASCKLNVCSSNTCAANRCTGNACDGQACSGASCTGNICRSQLGFEMGAATAEGEALSRQAWEQLRVDAAMSAQVQDRFIEMRLLISPPQG
jgi:hypothetical protein